MKTIDEQFESGELDAEYSDYIMNNPKGDMAISNSHDLLAAMESMYLRDEFIAWKLEQEKMKYSSVFKLMPPELQRIAEMCYDDMGRPLNDDSYILAVRDLLNLCNDLNEYLARYDQLFGLFEDKESRKSITIQWHCYIAGLLRASAELDSLAESV